MTCVTLQREGTVAVVTLHRPEKRNALTPEMLDGVEKWALEESAAGRTLVLAGEGAAFCAGFDLDLCRNDPGALGNLLRGLSRVIGALNSVDVAVVMAAQGAALGGGCALLGGADVVVTNRDARLGYPVARLGLSPGVSAPFLLRALAPGPCRRLLLEGGIVGGEEARRLGLAHECVEEAGQVREAAMGIARRLAAQPRGAWAVTKHWLREIQDLAEGNPAQRVRRGLEVSLLTAASEQCTRALRERGGG